MGTRQIEPDFTVSTSQMNTTGGADVDTILSDDSDATYLTPSGTQPDLVHVGFANPGPAVPALARILAVHLATRFDIVGGTIGSTAGARVTTPTKGDCPEQTMSVTASAPPQDYTGSWFVAGDNSEWSIADVDELESKVRSFTGFTGLRMIEQEITVTFNEAPTVTVTEPADEDTTTTGTTVVNTSTPTVAWTVSDPEGDPQERYDVRVWEEPTAGWTGFDPDTTTLPPVWHTALVLSSATSVTVGSQLANNTNFRAYVRVADTTPNGYAVRFGPWSFREFETDFVEPPAPTVDATPDQAAQTIDVSITDTGTPVPEHFVVERSDDGGATWTAIRDSPVAATRIPQYEALVLGDGPDAYWRLEDLTDEMGGFTLTDNGGVTFVPGQLADAAEFDGATNWLSNAAFTPAMTGAWSVEAWVSLDTIGTVQRVFHKGTSGAVDVYLSVNSLGRPTVNFVNPSGINQLLTADAAFTLTAGQWYHLVGTWDGTTLRLYVNGATTGNTLVPGSSPRDTGNELRIGRGTLASPSNHVNGKVDEVAVYPTTLTAAEVAAHYDIGTSPVTATDRFAPRGVVVQYRAAGVDTGLSPSGVQGPFGLSNEVEIVLDGNTFLRSPTDPDSDVGLCHATTRWTTNRAEDVVFYEAEGRADPIPVGGTVRTRRGVLALAFDTDAEFAAFEAIRARQEKLLLQTCFGYPIPRQLWVRLGEDVEDEDVVTSQSEIEGGWIHLVSVAFREVAEPS
jgi:hypothetical protein